MTGAFDIVKLTPPFSIIAVTARDRNGEGQGARLAAETGRARCGEAKRVRAGGARQARRGRRGEAGEARGVRRGRRDEPYGTKLAYKVDKLYKNAPNV